MSSKSLANSIPHNTEYPISTSNTNTTNSNSIEGMIASSIDTNFQQMETNSGVINKNNLTTSYSSCRRYVRNLKQYIFSLGSLDVQAAIYIFLMILKWNL